MYSIWFFLWHKRYIIYPIYNCLYASAKIFSLKPQPRFNFFYACILIGFIRIKVSVQLRKVSAFTPVIHALHNASNALEIIDILMNRHWIHFKCSFGLTLAAMSEKVRRMMIMARLYRAAKVTTPYNRKQKSLQQRTETKKLKEEQTIKKKNSTITTPTNYDCQFFVKPSLTVFKKINFNQISICGSLFFPYFAWGLNTLICKFLVRPE